MRRLVVLVMLCSLLSGCSTIGSSDGPALATARQAQGPADRAAANWAEDAVLAGAGAFEMDDEARREARDELDDELEEIREARDDGELEDDEYDNLTAMFDLFGRVVDTPDAAPGDGRAALWFFAYYSPADDTHYGVGVARGKVVYTEESSEVAEEFDLEDAYEDLGEWAVDSNDASAAAALGNADFTPLCEATNVISVSTLAQGDDGPVWYIGVERQDGEGDGPDEVALAVDAATGALVQDEVIEAVQVLYQEGGQSSQNVAGSAQTTFGTQFEVGSDGHLALAVDVVVSPAAQPVHVVVTDAAGAAHEFDVSMGPNPFNGQESILVEQVPVGVWMVEVEIGLPVTAQVSVSWCTDGEATSEGDFRPRACSVIDDFEAGGGGADARGETLSRLHRWLAVW